MKLSIIIPCFGLSLIFGCHPQQNDTVMVPQKPLINIKVEEVEQQCGVVESRASDGTSWDDYKSCITKHSVDEQVASVIKLKWDLSLQPETKASDRVCVRNVRSSSREVESCMHDCEVPTHNCIANTDPMTPERVACLQQDQNCKRSCAVAGRQGHQTTVPCSN